LALKLIDYDGMWVPALAGKKSGEVGHPSYQHPQRMREETYSLEVDRFSLLLVATALHALTVKGQALWEKFDNGDNLLFTEADLQAPTKSHLFLDLIRSGDPLTGALADHLLRALRGGVAAAPLLEQVLPEPQPATSAIRAPRPAAAPAGAHNGAAVAEAPVALAVVGHRGPVIRRVRTQTSRTRTAVWLAVALLLLAGLGAGWGVLRVMQDESGGPATGPAVVPPRAADTTPQSTDHGPLRVAPVDTRKEEKEPERPGETGKPKEPDKPQPERPRETGKPNETSKPPPAKPEEPRKPFKPPRPFVAKTFTNSIGMRLEPIEAGAFLMGSPPTEEGRNDLEGPQHEVRITRPFHIGSFPVTKGEFEKFVEATQHRTDAETANKAETWRSPGFPQTSEHPVVCVSWNDAMKFCQWLSQRKEADGRTYDYDLPTEAQWEYACRAVREPKQTTAYFFGNESAMLKDYAWYGENSEKETHPTGQLKRNPWNLYDMCGNVRQWCRDGRRAYATKTVDDPVAPETEDDFRVLRGGDWESDAAKCRSAARLQLLRSNSSKHNGFRVVREP
jgi:formylglycine-generating enzyme required for sulfatase activity